MCVLWTVVCTSVPQWEMTMPTSNKGTTRVCQYGQILVFFPSPVQCSCLVFLVTMGSSKAQWRVHEGAPKDCGRDPVLYFAKQVVLPGPARERTSRHSVKPVELELSASLGHPSQTRFGTALDRSTPHVSVTWPPDRQCDGLGRQHCSDRCAAGFARHQPWMKARRREDANERPKTRTCSSVGLAACTLKATEPSDAMNRWLTRREHLSKTGLQSAVLTVSVVSSFQRDSG